MLNQIHTETPTETPTEKYCAGCAQVRPLIDFHIDRSKPDGHTAKCKTCRNKVTARWRLQHPQEQRDYRQANIERIQRHRDRWKKEHYKEYRKLVRESAQNVREINEIRALGALGNRCAVCGEDDLDTLEFRAIKPEQQKYRSQLLIISWSKLETILRDYRLLCQNCLAKERKRELGGSLNQFAELDLV